jgi:urease accessory protein
MLAVGGGAAKRPAPWVAPLAFAALLFAGALLAQGGGAWTVVEPMVAASLVIRPAARRAVCAAHRCRRRPGRRFRNLPWCGPWRGIERSCALVGMVLATATLHIAGLALGRALRERSALLPRAAGAVIALFGLSLLC